MRLYTLCDSITGNTKMTLEELIASKEAFRQDIRNTIHNLKNNYPIYTLEGEIMKMVKARIQFIGETLDTLGWFEPKAKAELLDSIL